MNEYLRTDEDGIFVPPRHHILLLMDYVGEDLETDRQSMSVAFGSLEEAYRWSSNGLLFTIGYSPSYFKKVTDTEEVGLPEPSRIDPNQDPELDDADVCVHLASDHAHVVLAAEQALVGEKNEVNGFDMQNDIADIFTTYGRRTGFIGEGLPAEHQDVDGIPDSEPVPEKAPLYMGFESQHGLYPTHPDYDEDETKVPNQATEDRITINEGEFAGGTTQHVSRIELNLDEWYKDHSLEGRIKRMFEGMSDLESIGAVGQNAQEGNPFRNRIDESIEKSGVAAHAEKAARAREDDSPLILRRDFDTTDGGHAGVHFVALQESIDDFVQTRVSVTGTDLAEEYEEIGELENNGILEFIEVKRRANFLIPPRDMRFLPDISP